MPAPSETSFDLRLKSCRLVRLGQVGETSFDLRPKSFRLVRLGQVAETSFDLTGCAEKKNTTTVL